MKSPKGLSVAWQTATRRLVSYVGMLGLGGLFIRTKEPPAVGTIIQLLIDIPGGGVRARAIVRDIKPGEGMGVGIVSMGQEDRLRLSSFLSQVPPESKPSAMSGAPGCTNLATEMRRHAPEPWNR
ncbi:MAG: PilZ domain-containing protein [Candidatus Acidiferrales bacterium]